MSTIEYDTVLEAICDSWDADTALTTLVTGGRFTSIGSEGASMPYVTINPIGAEVEHVLKGGSSNTPHVERFRIQFSVFSDSTSPLASLNITDAIDDQYGVDGTLTVDGSEYRVVNLMRDLIVGPFWEKDPAYSAGGYWQTDIDYLFLLERAF